MLNSKNKQDTAKTNQLKSFRKPTKISNKSFIEIDFIY